jgi:hypothetical protein
LNPNWQPQGKGCAHGKPLMEAVCKLLREAGEPDEAVHGATYRQHVGRMRAICESYMGDDDSGSSDMGDDMPTEAERTQMRGTLLQELRSSGGCARSHTLSAAQRAARVRKLRQAR